MVPSLWGGATHGPAQRHQDGLASAPGSGWLFSPAVRTQLNLLGQLGLVLFMFLVGLELNPRLLQGRIPLANRVTTVGVLLPLHLGLAFAYGFEGWQPDLLPGDHSVAGALFMGTAMFTVGVLMALITTAMAGPLLATPWLWGWPARRQRSCNAFAFPVAQAGVAP